MNRSRTARSGLIALAGWLTMTVTSMRPAGDSGASSFDGLVRSAANASCRDEHSDAAMWSPGETWRPRCRAPFDWLDWRSEVLGVGSHVLGVSARRVDGGSRNDESGAPRGTRHTLNSLEAQRLVAGAGPPARRARHDKHAVMVTFVSRQSRSQVS